MRCDCNLALMGPGCVNAFIKRYRSSLQRFERHCAGDISQAR
jgi:hypothetical protein